MTSASALIAIQAAAAVTRSFFIGLGYYPRRGGARVNRKTLFDFPRHSIVVREVTRHVAMRVDDPNDSGGVGARAYRAFADEFLERHPEAGSARGGHAIRH